MLPFDEKYFDFDFRLVHCVPLYPRAKKENIR